MNQWEYFNQRANELERYNYKTPGVNVADPDGSVRKRRREIDSAQLQTAAELKKLREDLERIERKQDESSSESSKIGIATLVVTALGLAATIVFGMLQYLH